MCSFSAVSVAPKFFSYELWCGPDFTKPDWDEVLTAQQIMPTKKDPDNFT